MPTPQETRFARLAVTRKALSPGQIKKCLAFQAVKRKEGSKIPLWDSAVLQSMMEAGAAERLQDEVGDIELEKLEDFTLVRKLGQGAMGSVWLALAPDKQKVAVKVLLKSLCEQRAFVQRFFREAQASVKLQHRNIVRGLKVGEFHGYYFFAMEFVQGQSAQSRLDESGAFPSAEATDVILQIAEGLACAHEHGFIHRDLKPDNIMITKDGVAKLADLGLVRQMDEEVTRLTGTGTAMGTPYYMSPEQCGNAKDTDERSDIYSLGATWYHLVTGRVPFEGSSPLEVMRLHESEPIRWDHDMRGRIPRAVMVTIERMMAKDPDSRVQSARELCEVIKQQCLGDRDVLKELGLKGVEEEEMLWDVKVDINGRLDRRRLSEEQIKERIGQGQIMPDTPMRRVGTRGPFAAARKMPVVNRLFVSQEVADMATQIVNAEQAALRQKEKMHEAVAEVDKADRRGRRVRVLRKLKKIAVRLLIVAILLAAAGYFFRDRLAGFLGLAETP